MKKTIFIFLLLINWILPQQDHSEMIEGPFETGTEVTETCLTCHDTAGEEILRTRHWNWQGASFTNTRHGKITAGKKNLINNFCIAVSSNEPRCTSCHIGYGWKDNSFDFSDMNKIDCLVCHEQTGTYKKFPAGAGEPEKGLDLTAIAQSVGRPAIKNCGTCHFNGGGGTGVKHGDLDESLYEADENLDVHIGGLGFDCIECHVTKEHEISGAGHGSMMQGTNHFDCSKCHENKIHKIGVLDRHIKSIACETCHIPEFAKIQPTKTWWDWSKAGGPEDMGKDNDGNIIYDKMKGEFKWEKNVKPVYTWYNGKADYYLTGDKIDNVSVVKLNSPNGDINDRTAKIAPFKLMKGKQPFDPENRYIIVPNLYGSNGYWKTFNWESASEIGMKSVNLKFSGKVDFIETEMYWPINHMVAPADKALKCLKCHGSEGKKLLDWKALGYEKDPIKTRGRETVR
jgi:octaheme c-type cytochrome (tetrathionate reductase family)